MTGRASVYIVTKTDEDTPPEASTRPPKAKAAKQTEEEASQDTEDAEPEGLNRSKFGKFIMHYEPGTSFGEIALLSADAIRNASIIADMDTHLLVIDRALFNRSVKAKEEAAYKERYEFVEHNVLFSSWPVKPRRLLEMSLIKEIHPYGSVIMRQGNPARGLVFILSGQARVCMEPSRHESQYPALMKPPSHPLTTANKKPAVREKARAPRARKTHAQIEVRRHQGYAAAEKRLQGRTVDLCCIERNEVMGDTEMVLELDTNIATVVSTANTEVFVLNAKNFDRLVSKKNPHTVRQLVNSVCQKLAARIQTSKASQFPILARLHDTTKALQRRRGGSGDHYTRHHQAKDDNFTERSGKGGSEKTLVRLFLQGRVPLIKPYVKDSLFYREASLSKTKAIMNSPYAKLRSLNMLSTYTAMRRKAPRSIQQLKGNVKAERELLGYPPESDEQDQEQDYYAQEDNGTTSFARLPRRPASAAPGFQSARLSMRPFSSPRPRSAMDMRIVPCRDEDESQWGGTSYGFGSAGTGEEEKEEGTLDQNTVSKIFHHMDSVQRDKSESRMRVLCTNTARSELRTKLEREPAWSEGNPASRHGYEELYEDSFYDWETSEGNLRDLESRIASFCSPLNSSHRPRPTSSRARPLVTHMKRFEVEDPNSIPLPGGTVFVHQKPCRYTPNPSSSHHRQQQQQHQAVAINNAAASPHLHVRRFMLQRDRLSQVILGS
ncbi:hypothetical protein V1264_019506 [Littorina saxatilis]|uniref:Cyclic nucleotide-binding domain-containing protein n=3 Tax=Littorina saxatilis TaxID=31220 RepID=A0AAN9BGR4_9CAEN